MIRAALVALPGLLVWAGSSRAAEPEPVRCHGPGMGTMVLPTPSALVGAVAAAFDARMPPAEVAAQSSIRCEDGVVLACMTGANLDCGKADIRKTSQGGDAWCREHPDAPSVPMFATGHATIYVWRCEGTHAVPGRQARTVDAKGYVAENWRRLNRK